MHGSTICRYINVSLAQGHVFFLTGNNVFTLHLLNVGGILMDSCVLVSRLFIGLNHPIAVSTTLIYT